MKRFLLNTKSGMIVTYDEDAAKNPDMVEVSETEVKYRQGRGKKPGEAMRAIPQEILELIGLLPSSALDNLKTFLNDLLDKQEAEATAQARAGIKKAKEGAEATLEESTEEEADSGADEEPAEPEEKPLSRMSKVEMAKYAIANIADLEETEDDLLLLKKEELRSLIVRRQEG